MGSINLSRCLVTRINVCSCPRFLRATWASNLNRTQHDILSAAPSVGIFLDLNQSKNNFLTSRRYFSTCSHIYSNTNQSSDDAAIHDRIKGLLEKNTVVVFMKGVPEQPQCGFSNAVVQILRMHGVNYDAHNVLEDDQLRSGIKEYSEWPTIPQVYFKGEFIGGCDILLQMHQNGDLVDELKKIGIRSALLDKK